MGDVFRQHFTRNGVKKPLRKWYGEYKDKDGRVCRAPLSTDKQAARAMLRDLERQAERQKAGFETEDSKSRHVPIGGYVNDYLADMKLRGRGERHIADTKRLLNKVLKACCFDTLASLKTDPVDRYLANLTCSARTKNTHRQAVLGFANWLKLKKKVATNPIADTTRAEGATVIKRRALPLTQLQALLAVALERPLRDKLMVRSGPNKGQMLAKIKPETKVKMERQGKMRVLLYTAAFFTGLRRGELKALRVCHLTLDCDDPKVSLPGKLTKNGIPATLPLRADLASDLSEWIAGEGFKPQDLVFPIGRDVAKHLKRDMRSAEIDLYDANGRVFDFHALRKCTATKTFVGTPF